MRQEISLTASRPAARLATALVTAALTLGLVFGGNDVAFAQINVTATWDANADGRTAGYLVTVGNRANPSGLTIDVGAATRAVLPLPPGDVYYVTVRGYNAQRQTGPPSVEAAVDLASSPGAPQALQASVNGAVASLNWAPPSTGYATRYLLSVGTAPGADNLLSDYPVGNVTSVSGALPDGVYYARLQAGNLVGIGPTTPEVSFRVGGGASSVPATPTRLTSTWLPGGVITLSWDAANLASTYVIEVGSAPGATDLGAFNVGNVTAISTPVPPGTFYVRVRAYNAVGASGASNQVVVRR